MDRSKIFLALSDTTLRKKIKQVLTKEGYQVTGEAEEGNEALRKIRLLTPDLVILESDLPGLNGLEVAKIIEEDRLAPVLLITSYWQNDLLQKVRESWVFALVSKPVQAANLVAAVESAMLNFERIVQLEQEVNKLKETLATRKLIERAKGILMETMGLTEAEAFRRIQKQSMDKCTSMKAIAEAIIMAYDLQKG